jgi:hypothetical protein
VNASAQHSGHRNQFSPPATSAAKSGGSNRPVKGIETPSVEWTMCRWLGGSARPKPMEAPGTDASDDIAFVPDVDCLSST